jgi:phasin family protein
MAHQNPGTAPQDANRAAVATFFSLADVILSGAQRMAELNHAAGKALLAEAAGVVKRAPALRDWGEVRSAAARACAPGIEQTVEYSRNAYEICRATSASLMGLAVRHGGDFNTRTIDAIREAARALPHADGEYFAALASALEATHQSFIAFSRVLAESLELIDSLQPGAAARRGLR